MEKITKLTIFEDPTLFIKKAKGQWKNGDILTQAKIPEINIKNNYEFLKGNSVVTQVFQEDIRLETHKNIPYTHYVFTYKIICRKKFEWKCNELFQ